MMMMMKLKKILLNIGLIYEISSNGLRNYEITIEIKGYGLVPTYSFIYLCTIFNTDNQQTDHYTHTVYIFK